MNEAPIPQTESSTRRPATLCRHGNDDKTCESCAETGMLKATIDSLKEELGIAYGRGVTAGKLEALNYTREERERYGQWSQGVEKLRDHHLAERATQNKTMPASVVHPDTKRLDHLAKYVFYPDDHPNDSLLVVVPESIAPVGTFSLNPTDDATALRKVIDAAISDTQEEAK